MVLKFSKKQKIHALGTLIIHWQENQYEHKMNEGLSKISDLYKQLEFLNEFELKYKDEVQSNPHLADASGVITAGNPYKAGFDAMIQNMKYFINHQIERTKTKRKKIKTIITSNY